MKWEYEANRIIKEAHVSQATKETEEDKVREVVVKNKGEEAKVELENKQREE